jgi:hypothetical protein
VALLAAGSVALTVTAAGAARGVAGDDLTVFFARPSLAHLWLYLLIPTLTLYAVNTLLCTYDTVVRRWRRGVRAPAAYAGAVMHLAFLVALLAHGAGGLLGRDEGTVVVGPAPVTLADGRVARTAALAVARLPSGMPRSARAIIELTRPGRLGVERATVGYNEPLSAGLGTRLGLLADYGAVAGAARLALGAERCVAELGSGCEIDGTRLVLRDLRPMGRGFALAEIAVARAAGPERVHRLTPGGAVLLADGTPLRLEEVIDRPAVALRGRVAPGNPFALVAGALLALGLAMMGRRLIRPR